MHAVIGKSLNAKWVCIYLFAVTGPVCQAVVLQSATQDQLPTNYTAADLPVS